MTLIITELSEYGISMAADSAVTIISRNSSGVENISVRNGVRKLQVIPYLSAGISVWGQGQIHTAKGRQSTDTWLEHFINEHSGIGTIDDFAIALAERLQRQVGLTKDMIGFHVAGYVLKNERPLPVFYHVRNVDGNYADGYKFKPFTVGQDYPPSELPPGCAYTTRNGDYGDYARFIETKSRALSDIVLQTWFAAPNPTLKERVAFHAECIRYISDAYERAGHSRTIGDVIDGLAIYHTGKYQFFPNLKPARFQA
jgi:hypothetical protein